MLLFADFSHKNESFAFTKKENEVGKQTTQGTRRRNDEKKIHVGVCCYWICCDHILCVHLLHVSAHLSETTSYTYDQSCCNIMNISFRKLYDRRSWLVLST